MQKTAAFIFLTLCLCSSVHAGGSAQEVLELPFKTAEAVVDTVFDLGKISVSGKRLGSPFSEFVANNVSSAQVISRQDLLLSGAQNLPQALSEAPGVILSDLSGNGEEPTVDFRGFNQGQDLVFLLDGVRLNEPKSNSINFPLIPTSLIDRIEINRGGASFLYGEGATGGVANIVGLFPKKKGAYGKVQTLVGGFREWGENFETSVNTNGVGAYLTGDIYHVRGFRQNSSVEKQDFYTKFIWDVFEKSRLALTYLHARANLDRSGSIRESLMRTLGRQATERPRNFSELGSDLGILDLNVGEAESVVLSTNIFLRRSTELSVANFATFDTDDNELDLTMDSWGFTLQADHSRAVIWDITEGFLLGVDYVKNNIDEKDYNRSKATQLRLNQTVDSLASKEAAGFFSKVSLSWNERLGAYVGMRYDNIQFRNTDRINVDNNDPSEVSKLSSSIGVSYEPCESLALSGRYSHSFRSPTLADLYANPVFGSNSALKPEESSDYEAGLQIRSGEFLMKAAFFLNRRTNEIGFDPNLIDGSHPFGSNSNFGKTERVGVENFMESWVFPGLRLRASHTYTEAVFQCNAASGAQISGDHIPMVPRNRFTSGILIQPSKELDLSLDLISVAKQVLTNDLTNDRNGRRLPAYTVCNFRTAYRIKSWEISFEMRNLFDERYEIGGSVGAAPSPFNSDHTVEDNFFVPAPGRSCRGTFRYSW